MNLGNYTRTKIMKATSGKELGRNFEFFYGNLELCEESLARGIKCELRRRTQRAQPLGPTFLKWNLDCL